MKPNFHCNYTVPVDLAPNGIRISNLSENVIKLIKVLFKLSVINLNLILHDSDIDFDLLWTKISIKCGDFSEHLS